MKVPFFDATDIDRSLRDDLLAACQRVIVSGAYILGPEVEAFEQEAAAYLGARHAIGVSSGTDALIVALLALGIGPGDEMIVPAYTFVATASAVVRVGARPVFVDVDAATLTIDASLVEAEIRTSATKPKAIIPVHLFGRCAPMINLVEAVGWDMPLIEDAAQMFAGGTGLGALACHSFYPTKNLGGFGDGGLVTTDDDRLAERARMLRGHGSRERYRHEEIGGNYRLDELQAALLRVKMRRVDAALAARQEHAMAYETRLTVGWGIGLEGSPVSLPPRGGTFNQYVIRVRGDGARDRLRAHLAARGVGTEVYYPVPLHLQPCFAGLGYRAGDFPVAERAARETLALPIFPELTDDEIAYVVEQIAAFF